MGTFTGFGPGLVKFLGQLERNNNRAWFEKYKPRYEAEVLEPALAFIAEMAAPLEKIAPHFAAIPKRSGGSLMRVYRDTRFSKDKRPYKTNVGIQFRHESGKDVHAPGYYVHIDPQHAFLGVGVWHPDSAMLANIRRSIVERPAAWKKARDHKPFRAQFELEGESLSRPPRGHDPDHPYIEDLKRKDFIAVKPMTHENVVAPQLLGTIAASFRSATPFMRFLCEANGVEL